MLNEEPRGERKWWSMTFVSGAFAIALAMLYVLVLRSIAVQLAPPPENINEPYPDVNSQVLCEEAGGRWSTRGAQKISRDGIAQPVPLDIESQAYCQGPLKFERERIQQTEDSRQMSLFVFMIGGALVVAGSLLLKYLKPVAPGMMIGGIISFFIAGIHVWTLSPGLGRLITIVVVFIMLTVIGIRVFKDNED